MNLLRYYCFSSLNLYLVPPIDATWILPLPSLLESKVRRIGLSPLLVLFLHLVPFSHFVPLCCSSHSRNYRFMPPAPPSHMQHENYRWRQFTRVQTPPHHL
ncbi:hypothetical protein BDZ91DRAFT_742270 [Kalaharituber pfeilii]|nr:hypothetical protein BDZ91DRAFT_750482 [Kalaharituber pfeilii]KAF8459160.1 hypothetical protein BDZ91DRAFT_742270 [Kalaharituber pfeilii]